MRQNKVSAYGIVLLYACVYMADAVYSTFIPVYLDNVGFDEAMIGILLSIGPLIAIMFQPLWGIASDRAKAKNYIIQILLIISAFIILAYRISSNFWYMLFVITAFSVFYIPIKSLTDAIAIELSESTQTQFGRIRLGGSLGYAVMSVIGGILAEKYLNSIFLLYFGISMGALIILRKLPEVKGYQHDGSKASPLEIIQGNKLALFIIFNFILSMTFGFNATFFPIYFQRMGASRALLGWAMFIATLGEIPFLLFADKIAEKFGIYTIFMLSGIAFSIRWLLMGLATDIYMILLVQLLSGLNLIVLSFSTITYINSNVKKELKATAQVIAVTFGISIPIMLGSVAGGFLIELIGMKQVYICNALLAFIAVVVFAPIFMRSHKLENTGGADA